MKEYKELVTSALSTAEMRSRMVVNYLKDVSTMLDIASAVQSENITQHLQVKRQGQCRSF